jgi:hypothetical protein
VPNNVNSRSQTYIIAQAMQRCARCSELTAVIGIVLPAGHETLATDPDADEVTRAADLWEVAEADAALFYIEHLSEGVLRRLRQFSQHYRIDSSDAAERLYWMNHCSLCGMSQGDFELHCEPEGAFVPISAEAAASIRMQEVLEPFAAQAAGYAYAPEFFDQAQR